MSSAASAQPPEGGRRPLGAAPEPLADLQQREDWSSDRTPDRRFRDILGRFPTGVTVVTGVDPEGEPVGLTCQSFASVSLDPPLVLFCPARTSRAWPVIAASGSFCVNLLAADQHELAARMAVSGADKFTGLGWHPSPATGSPVLPGGIGYVDCQIEAIHPGGDHEVVIGRVLHLSETGRSDALTFYRGRYGATD